MFSVIVLFIGVLTYLVFGLLCFSSLVTGTDVTSVQFLQIFPHRTPNVTYELFSMYGGIQVGLGVFYFLAIFKPQLREGALWVLVLVPGCLFMFRGFALVTTAGEPLSFQYTALAVELITCLLAMAALRRVE